ncbi:hypothetical protein [Streptomyces abikoensis]|uniref:Secreted protein n=1 Tax=Streptomyces abikoensis TaxID=97398 RepID=A0ABW7T4P6_9ACTN
MSIFKRTGVFLAATTCAILAFTSTPASAAADFHHGFRGGWDSPSATFGDGTATLAVTAKCESNAVSATLYHERPWYKGGDEPVGGQPALPCDGQQHTYQWHVYGGSYHLHFRANGNADVEGSLG